MVTEKSPVIGLNSLIAMKCETISDLIRFLGIQEQALGEQSPEVASTVSKLADMYVAKGMLDDAEKLYERALSIRERAIGPHKTEAQETRNSLARIKALKSEDIEPSYSTIKNKSKSSCQETSDSLQSISKDDSINRLSFSTGSQSREIGVNSVDTSTSLDTLTSNQSPLTEKGLGDKVRELELEVELIRQVSGSSSLPLTDCLTRLADLYCRTKLYSSMEPILEEALKIRELHLGHDHYLVANSLKNLARLYYFQNKLSKSKAYFESAINVRKTVFGARHPKVAEALTQYAKLLRKMNRIEEANQIDAEVHSIRAKHGSWHRL